MNSFPSTIFGRAGKMRISRFGNIYKLIFLLSLTNSESVANVTTANTELILAPQNSVSAVSRHSHLTVRRSFDFRELSGRAAT
ncbi:hypothetical protein PUN28_015073 [Cardiocondyla obscurior]|uniref:Uncharacterized protein n=1 Tax=Cardiocondyla obscurior TaxID=286306 RepID=A0AAW2EY82_9HYME